MSSGGSRGLRQASEDKQHPSVNAQHPAPAHGAGGSTPRARSDLLPAQSGEGTTGSSGIAQVEGISSGSGAAAGVGSLQDSLAHLYIAPPPPSLPSTGTAHAHAHALGALSHGVQAMSLGGDGRHLSLSDRVVRGLPGSSPFRPSPPQEQPFVRAPGLTGENTGGGGQRSGAAGRDNGRRGLGLGDRARGGAGDQQWMGGQGTALNREGEGVSPQAATGIKRPTTTYSERRTTITTPVPSQTQSSPVRPPPAPLGESTTHRQSSLIPGSGSSTGAAAWAPLSLHKGQSADPSQATRAFKRDRAADVQYHRRAGAEEDKENQHRNRQALAPLDPFMLFPLAETLFSPTAPAPSTSASHAATSASASTTAPSEATAMPRTPKRLRTSEATASRSRAHRTSTDAAEANQRPRSSSAQKLKQLVRTGSMTLRSGTEVAREDLNATPTKRRNELELTIAAGLAMPQTDEDGEVDSANLSAAMRQPSSSLPATTSTTDEGIQVLADESGDVVMEVGKASTTDVGILDMPDEILMEIILYLPLTSVLALSPVSRKFNVLAADPIVWQNLYFKTPGFRIRRPRQPYRIGQTTPKPGEVIVDGDAFFSRTTDYWIPLAPFDAAHTPAGKNYRRPLWHRYDETDKRLAGERPISPATTATWSEGGTPLRDHSGQGAWSSPLVQNSANASASARQLTSEPNSQLSGWRAFSPMSPSGIVGSVLGSSSRSQVYGTPPSARGNTSLSVITTPPQIARPLDWRTVYRERVQLEERWKTGSYTSCVILPQAHKEAIYCVQILHDRLVTGSRDKHVRFWSIEIGATNEARATPRLIYDLVDAHTKSVLCLQIEEGTGSDGQGMMVCGSSDFNISVWELRGALDPERSRAGLKGKQCKPKKVKLLRGHSGGVLDVVMSKERLVSCSKDASIRIWSRHDYTLLHNIKDHAGPVNALALKSDGTLVSAAGDGCIMMFDVNTGRIIREYHLSNGLACVDYKGNTIISGSSDLFVRATDSETGETLVEMEGHTDLVRTLEYDHEHGRAVSGSYDATLFLWDIKKGVPIKQLENRHSGMCFNARLDVTKIVSTSHDCSMMVHDFAGGLKYAALFA